MDGSGGAPARLPVGFIAGFLATLIFHRLTLALLWHLGLAPFAPFSMAATRPLGVPAVFSLSFWGGLWGMLLAALEGRFPRGGGYWGCAFLFGAICPSLAALLVVLPIKGQPLGGGWHVSLLTTAFVINGAWGFGSALILRTLSVRDG
jgi:hypothetical protein